MNFQYVDSLVDGSGRRSIASSLIAHLLDSIDNGEQGLDLDTFQERTHFIRNNITSTASYLQSHGIIQILYFRDNTDERQYSELNRHGRWGKQHYRLSGLLKKLYRRN